MTARKKAAKSARIRTSLRSKGATLLLALPLDILLEILRIVQPLDLLYLSRTNKSLRDFLLDRSNAFVWRESLQFAESSPPKCPSYMTEVQWTRLLFEEACHVCCSPLEHDFSFDPIWWEFSARYCSECSSTQVTKKFPKELSWRSTRTNLPGVFPCISGYYLVRDLNDFKTKYLSATEEGRKTLTEERRDQTKTLNDHARVCEPWMAGILKAHRDALTALKNARWADIQAKFSEAGWRNAVKKSEWENNPVVTTPQPLSDAEWQTIGPKLLEELEAKVKPRVMAARFHALKQVFKNLSKLTEYLAFAPSMADVAFFPDVRAILEGDLKLPVSAAHLVTALQSKLPKLVKDWSTAFEEKLRNHTRAVLGLPSSSNVDPFKLAVAYFVCENHCCEGYFTGHWKACHGTVENYRSTKNDPAPETYEDFAVVAFRRKPCRVNNMLTSSARTVLEDIVKHYGKDPKSATCEEMDAAPGKLYCMRCVEKNQPTGWRNAVRISVVFSQYGAAE
ncbi:hypothetical protein C8R47DRAFT_1110711 [Mycena vitilis]|nr:hypothetical protein C8R47DRAFT_1110711 [Mycena vitilis]